MYKGKSVRQQFQWRLRQTLGSVCGLPYWNNAVIEQVKARGVDKKIVNKIALAMLMLNRALYEAELDLRHKLKNIPPKE